MMSGDPQPHSLCRALPLDDSFIKITRPPMIFRGSRICNLLVSDSRYPEDLRPWHRAEHTGNQNSPGLRLRLALLVIELRPQRETVMWRDE